MKKLFKKLIFKIFNLVTGLFQAKLKQEGYFCGPLMAHLWILPGGRGGGRGHLSNNRQVCICATAFLESRPSHGVRRLKITPCLGVNDVILPGDSWE